MDEAASRKLRTDEHTSTFKHWKCYILGEEVLQPHLLIIFITRISRPQQVAQEPGLHSCLVQQQHHNICVLYIGVCQYH